MKYGEYYFILPNAWAYGNEPQVKRLGADTTWQEPITYVEDNAYEGAAVERIWLSRRIDQLNIIANDDAEADNIIKFNHESGELAYAYPGGPFTDWDWNTKTGYFKRAWSTRSKDAPGYPSSDRPVSTASDNIRECRRLLGIEALHGAFEFPWWQRVGLGQYETNDPCGALTTLALMQACGRLVGWRSDLGYFSDQRGFGGGILGGPIVPIAAYCPFEDDNKGDWDLWDVTVTAKHFISIYDPGKFDKMFLLFWKRFVIPPRAQWPEGFLNFNHDPVEVTLWPES